MCRHGDRMGKESVDQQQDVEFGVTLYTQLDLMV